MRCAWVIHKSNSSKSQIPRKAEQSSYDESDANSFFHRIMRICNLLPSYQVLSFVSICFPNSYIYLQGYTEVFNGIALYSFLMLLCDFMAPTDQSKVEFFSSLETKRQWQPKKKRNGLAFLKVSGTSEKKSQWRWWRDSWLNLVDLVVCVAIPSHYIGYCCQPDSDSSTACILP